MLSDNILIEGCFPLYPLGKKSVRGKGTQFYMPKDTKEFMSKVAYFGRSIYKGEPLAIPLSLDITFAFPREGHRLKPKHSDQWMCQKPDLSNLLKNFEDGLNGVIWQDDCWIVEERISKVWHDSPEIWLLVKPATKDIISDQWEFS